MNKVFGLTIVYFCMVPGVYAESLLYSKERQINYQGLFLEAAIQREIYGNVTSKGTGVSVDAGWNISEYFGQNFLMVPFYGASGLFGSKYNSDFLKDFGDQESENQPVFGSAEAHAALIAANKTDIVEERRWGLLFQLPIKYMPPLKLYAISYSAGIRISTYEVYYTDGTSDTRANIISLKRSGVGLEAYLYSLGKIGAANLGYISVYLNRLNFGNASMENDVSWKNYQKNRTSRYDNEIIVGIKFGINTFGHTSY